MNIERIVADIDAEIDRLQRARTALTGGPTRVHRGARGRRKMSAAARARISAAQRARWARVRGGAKKT